MQNMQSIKSLSLLALASLCMVGCKTTYYPSATENSLYRIDHSIEADSAIVNYYIPFKLQMEKEMNRQIGYSKNFLSKNRSEGEFLAGNFFADAMLAIGKSIDPQAQIAIATKGGIRSEIKQGPITIGSMFEMMPFENAITILELSGKDILTLANFIAKTGGQPIAGCTIVIKDGMPQEFFIQGQPVDLDKSYKLVTYDYLANGGDYIDGIQSPIKRTDTPTLVRDALIKYVEGLTKQGKNINTTLDGRIKIIK